MTADRPRPPRTGADPIDRLLALPTWAVVGLSPRPSRESHGVARRMQRAGYRIVPVNPEAGTDEILGEPVHPTLAAAVAAVGPVDVVDVFRRSSLAGRHVDEAIDVGAVGVWLQLGVVDEAAARRARAAGLVVVMDRCAAVERAVRDVPIARSP